MRAGSVARLLVLGLAVLVGGCGGGGGGTGGGTGTAEPGAATSPPTAGDGRLDVCALVGAEDVAAVLGEPAEAGIDNSSVDLRVCSWTGLADRTEVLTISIYVHPDAGTAREQYLATTEGLGGVEILNLADEASYSDTFGLRVLSGRYDVGIDSTGDDEKASSIRIAQGLLPQLP
jgi:hypothetical protein